MIWQKNQEKGECPAAASGKNNQEGRRGESRYRGQTTAGGETTSGKEYFLGFDSISKGLACSKAPEFEHGHKHGDHNKSNDHPH